MLADYTTEKFQMIRLLGEGLTLRANESYLNLYPAVPFTISRLHLCSSERCTQKFDWYPEAGG